MTLTLPADGPRGSELASWTPLTVLLGAFAVLLLLLAVRGVRTGRPLLGVPARLEARTGLPGWAAVTLLVALAGLLVAGQGFEADVAWHVALGRDEALFTAPHTSILVGLSLIAAAPAAGAAVVLLDQDGVRRWSGGGPMPPSLRPLAVLGTAALLGFPLDELWHRAYGVDVTMWSPPHLLMILAASFTPLALWLVLADAGVRPRDSRVARTAHVVVAALVLLGLSSVQGEFEFGVPQWSQLFHPVLFCLAAGLGLLLARLVHGPWWALGIATVVFALQLPDDGGPVETRTAATFLGAAVVVELAARLLGTDRPVRLALAVGVGTGTAGLAVEAAWNTGAVQPWTPGLVLDALPLGVLAATSAALLAVALAPALTGGAARPLPRTAAVLGLAGVVLSLALPAPRGVGDVRADVRLAWVDADRAVVDVQLTPADAADDARWFFVGSWQWGGRTTRLMQPAGDGRWSSVEPVELTGRAKALLRLHRGDELMAVPVRLPADDAFGLPEVPAVDRSQRFEAEQQYLQREASRPDGLLAVLVPGAALSLAAAFAGVLAWAAGRVAGARAGAGTTTARPRERERAGQA